ncbi:inter-alpha-trypsin inhibitor [Amia ocellicauda]|uniref:inter-alpha-trypsin inhibitor n=1 Tax=Amia ocellicauda TaxID=2972642 RepID=UPI0034646275
MDPGTGDKFLFRLFYNKITKRCEPFMYKGNGGNGNRFITDKMCMKNCSDEPDKFYPNDRSLLIDTADWGLLHYLLWYYNVTKQKCKTFYYTGCGGNGNRFISHDICNSTCAYYNNTVIEDDDEDIPEKVSVGLMVGSILWCFGVIIFIIVIVFVVTGKKSPKKDFVPLKQEKEVIEME